MADEKLDMDTVPARIHEELRRVMLGERRRAEKAEREGQQVVEALLGEPVSLPASYYPIAVAVRELRIQWRETERERDEALTLIEEWQDASGLCSPPEEQGGDPGGVTPKMAREYWEQVETERDAALARVRELEAKLAESESNSAWLDRAQELSAQLDAIATGADKIDADELAAFRWLVGWLKEKFRDGEEYSLAACDSGIGIFFTGNILVVKESTPVALATALDPNWREAGSKKD